MAPTGRHRARLTGLAGPLGAVLLILLTLAGCASGNVEDASQFETQEAEKTAVLPQIQATELAERFGTPSGSPEPTMTPIATLARLVLTRNIGSNGAPEDEIRSIPAYTPFAFTAAAQIGNLQPGQTVTATFITAEGQPIFSQEQSVTSGSSPQWIVFPFQLDGSTPPGVYGVAIAVEGEPLSSIAFRIG